MNIRTPAACCHKHRSNNEVKWKTLMNTSTLPRSPTSLYIPVAGSKYTTVWWNKHSRAHTHTHTVRESPESWDWIKSFSPFSSSFHGFLPTEREEGRHSQSQRSEEWPSLTDRPGDWNTNQPFPAIGLGSAPAALLGQLAEAVAKKKNFTNYHCQNYRAGLKISLNMLQVCYHCIGPLSGQSAKTSKIELIAKL